jgi:ligand-binding sensor domain-containing protein
MVRQRFLLIAMLLVASHLCAQQPSLKFDHIGLEQGLSESIVFAITQDTKCYMWFGTADGLNRFDGYELLQSRSSCILASNLSFRMMLRFTSMQDVIGQSSLVRFKC